MAEHNLIQRPDLLYRLQQFLGLRQAHVVPVCSETLQPVVIVGDIRDEETGKKGGTTAAPYKGRVWANLAASAANYSRAKLRNPAGSKRIVRVRNIVLTSTGDVQVLLNQDTGNLATNLSLFSLDSTLHPGASFTGEFTSKWSTDQTAAPSGGTEVARFPAASGLATPPAFDLSDVILEEGWQLEFQAIAVNSALTVYTLSFDEWPKPQTN